MKVFGGRNRTKSKRIGELKHLKVPGDVSMLRRVLETMAAFLSMTNTKPSALMSLTTPLVSSSSSSGSRGDGASPLPNIASAGIGLDWICSVASFLLATTNGEEEDVREFASFA
jgi:hypothetical protein